MLSCPSGTANWEKCGPAQSLGAGGLSKKINTVGTSPFTGPICAPVMRGGHVGTRCVRVVGLCHGVYMCNQRTAQASPLVLG